MKDKTIKELIERGKKAIKDYEKVKLSTKEIDKVFDTLTRHLGQKLGIEIMFPSIETLMLERSIKQMN